MTQTEFYPERAQAVLDRLLAAEAAGPAVDTARAEDALRRHFVASGLEPPRIRWAIDIEEAGRAAQDAWAAWDARAAQDAWAARAAWDARAARAAWDARAARAAWDAWDAWAARDAWDARAAHYANYALYASFVGDERAIGVWSPFVDAYEAGLFLFWFTGEHEILALARPVMHMVDDRLHCEDGPAIWWPNAARYWFWRGVEVPQQVIESPESLTAEQIWSEGNVEVRRALLERVGYERLLGLAAPAHRDDYGELYVLDQTDDEPVLLVKVVNSSPEPDGSYKEPVLRVHPQIRPMSMKGNVRKYGPPQKRTALNAVASTFGMVGDEYRLGVES